MKEYVLICDRCKRKDGMVKEHVITIGPGDTKAIPYRVDLCYLCLSDLAAALLLTVERGLRVSYLKRFVNTQYGDPDYHLQLTKEPA